MNDLLLQQFEIILVLIILSISIFTIIKDISIKDLMESPPRIPAPAAVPNPPPLPPGLPAAT